MTTKDDVIKHILNDKFYDNVLVTYLSNKSERNEFRQELWLILLEMNETKLIKYYDDKCLKYIYIGIINNQIKSSSSPWHRKFRMNQPMEYDVNTNDSQDQSDIDIDNKVIRDIRIDYIEKQLEYLERKDPYLKRDITIFKESFYNKMSYRKISAKYNIATSSVYLYVNNIKFLLIKDKDKIKYD